MAVRQGLAPPAEEPSHRGTTYLVAGEAYLLEEKNVSRISSFVFRRKSLLVFLLRFTFHERRFTFFPQA